MRSGLRLFLPTLLCVTISGPVACSMPEGDQSTPTQMHYLWVGVRAAGDADRMWDLLHPDVRTEFERWLKAEQEAIKEIQTAYPKEDAAAALAAIGGPERAKIDSAKSLFKGFVNPSPEAPGTLGAVAAHVRTEELGGDGKTATIRTWGGDEVRFIKSGDKWFATLAPDEALRLKNARARAEQNLERVKSNLEKLGRNKK